MSLDYDDPRMFLWTALMAAIYGRHTNVVAYLLEKGVDLEARDAHGNTALMLAVDVADTSLTVIEMLVRAGARIDVTNEYGRTALDAVQASAERHRILGIVSRHQRSNGRLNPIPTH
jgi:ankyrin repeat protein